MLIAQAIEQAKKIALRDDGDAFSVVIGSRAAVLEGQDNANVNVEDITINNFSVSARGKELLKNTSVKIIHEKRYGLVGPNGTGKSTLLKLLAWRKIPAPKNIVVALLNSSFAAVEYQDDDDTSGLDVVEKLTELYEKLQLMGSDAVKAQATKILVGLSFTKDMQGCPTRSFSGGWRMRISLARALFVQPTLLLDEPTNHLDLKAVLWLEEYLCRWKKTLVVVSHDRDFLNIVCNEFIHLHDLKLHSYSISYDNLESEYEQICKEMNKL
ncbi:hypothetical protein POM88_028502 [Heracleum sosnowskyi]|uniref:ABC transporter domain-containing protein n=1 Tax=Heracleum sosnowskyi TaxID=360622 RepID=A0AAD8HRZ3_9APIA|nr:hypothetical protein POM88_028502 [Heracleum sosnowskyi]